MRRFLPLLLSSCALLSACAPQQPKNTFTGAPLQQYAIVVGGWYMDQKCHYLQGEEKKSFESDVAYNTNFMRATLGVTDAMMQQWQDAAKKVSDMPEWACGTAKSRDVVVGAVTMARMAKVRNTMNPGATPEHPLK